MDDPLVLDLIAAGVLAGAYASLAQDLPDYRTGLLKLADRSSAAAARFACELVRRGPSRPGRAGESL